MKTPYRYWVLADLEKHLLKQCEIFNIDKEVVVEAIYSTKWNPLTEFNGCNVIQDDLHPFLPCFIHDYRWIVYGRTREYDKEFRANLIKSGYSKIKANFYYISVRVGSVYFKIFK